MKRPIPLLPESPEVVEARARWRYTGLSRPPFAEEPTEGQVSVWDFPRPPVMVRCTQRLTVRLGDTLVADSRRGVRVLETASAPTYYLPPEDIIERDLLEFGDLTSICEWKGVAQTISVGGVADAGWRYVRMFPAFAQLFEWVSFYPGKLCCCVDGERAQPQPGGFYGGWVTADLAGPIKGEPGSSDW